jgi:hypothetical protein
MAERIRVVMTVEAIMTVVRALVAALTHPGAGRV